MPTVTGGRGVLARLGANLFHCILGRAKRHPSGCRAINADIQSGRILMSLRRQASRFARRAANPAKQKTWMPLYWTFFSLRTFC